MLEWHCTKFVPLYLVLELILKRGELQGCKKIDALLWDLGHLNFRRHYRQISRALMPIPFFWDVAWLQYEIRSWHWLQISQAKTHWRNFLNNSSVELPQGFKIKISLWLWAWTKIYLLRLQRKLKLSWNPSLFFFVVPLLTSHLSSWGRPILTIAASLGSLVSNKITLLLLGMKKEEILKEQICC